jgi:tRNA-specific 2-thiouridylase
MSTQKTVFVGLSGGVDSSVAALRLIKQGYKVVGVFIKVWHPDFLVCNWEQERLDAMRIAAKLGIPFLTCDAEAEYRDAVAHYFIESYRLGLTPNPDVMCNKEVKFGAFFRFAFQHGADFIATGHYARREEIDNKPVMLRGLDKNKDQSYFLWTLTEDQLKKILFPVGNSVKSVIREEAGNASLITADKRDSQGVCFLGHIDIPDFLSHYINLVTGDVVDENGKVIGTHRGVFVYTIGQRQGFTLTNNDANRAPLYIIKKDTANNILVVSEKKPVLKSQVNLILIQYSFNTKIEIGETLSAQTRYRQTPFSVIVSEINENSILLFVENETDAVATGQSCVLYRGEQCLGGGIIT